MVGELVVLKTFANCFLAAMSFLQTQDRALVEQFLNDSVLCHGMFTIDTYERTGVPTANLYFDTRKKEW